jgi:hypothetical protein
MDTTQQQQQQEDVRTRQKLAVTIVMAGLIVVGLLCVSLIVVAGITKNPDAKDATHLVLSSVLPLVGTWVGTVLAFYFAKDNFETASRATKELLGAEGKLKSIPVTKAMIIADKIDAFKLGSKAVMPNGSAIDVPKVADDISVDSALDFLNAKNRTRLPVLESDGRCVYVAHASVLDKFCSDELRKSQGSQTIPTGQTQSAAPAGAAMASAPAQCPRTFKDFRQKSPKLFDSILGWACVPETASLADAKHAMETTPNCQDVMVTKTGKADSPVVGWLTNIEIAQNSKA